MYQSLILDPATLSILNATKVLHLPSRSDDSTIIIPPRELSFKSRPSFYAVLLALLDLNLGSATGPYQAGVSLLILVANSEITVNLDFFGLGVSHHSIADAPS